MLKSTTLKLLAVGIFIAISLTLAFKIEVASPLGPEVTSNPKKGYFSAFISHTEKDEGRRQSLHQLLEAFLLIANSLSDEELVMVTEIVVDAASCVYVNHGLDDGMTRLKKIKWLVFNSSEKLRNYEDFIRLARERGITLPTGTGCKKE